MYLSYSCVTNARWRPCDAHKKIINKHILLKTYFYSFKLKFGIEIGIKTWGGGGLKMPRNCARIAFIFFVNRLRSYRRAPSCIVFRDSPPPRKQYSLRRYFAPIGGRVLRPTITGFARGTIIRSPRSTFYLVFLFPFPLFGFPPILNDCGRSEEVLRNEL